MRDGGCGMRGADPSRIPHLASRVFYRQTRPTPITTPSTVSSLEPPPRTAWSIRHATLPSKGARGRAAGVWIEPTLEVAQAQLDSPEGRRPLGAECGATKLDGLAELLGPHASGHDRRGDRGVDRLAREPARADRRGQQ